MNFIKLNFNQHPFLLDPTHIMTVETAFKGHIGGNLNTGSSVTLTNGRVMQADETVEEISDILDSVEGITAGGNARTVK